MKLSFYNLIMLFPLGVYLSLIFNVKNLKKAIIILFLSSLFIEVNQLIFGYLGFLSGRTFNVDDLMLNTLGGALGFMVFKMMKKMYTFKSILKNEMFSLIYCSLKYMMFNKRDRLLTVLNYLSRAKIIGKYQL